LGVGDELRHGLVLADGGSLERLGHGPDMGSALFVLVEHHARGAALTRKAFGLHRREEVGFLLAVVAAVGEVAEEVQGLLGRGIVQSPLGCTALGNLFQAIEHLFDDAMFAAEDFGGVHGTGSLRNACRLILLKCYLPAGQQALIWIKPLSISLAWARLRQQAEVRQFPGPDRGEPAGPAGHRPVVQGA
jgi:hypothetical protein